MAEHRTPTPAMLAHLRAIAHLGGKSTSSRYGGWAAPHAARRARKATGAATPPRTSMRTKVVTATHASGVATGKSSVLPKSIFPVTASKLAPKATTKAKKGTALARRTS